MIELTLHLIGLIGALGLFLFAGDSLSLVSPLAAWALALLVVFSLRRARIPSFFSFFALCYGLLFLLYPIIRPLMPNPLDVDPQLFVNYTFLVVSGAHLFMGGYALASTGRGRGGWPSEFQIDQVRLVRVLTILLAINVAAIALKILSAGSISVVLGQTRRELKMGYGVLNVVSIYMGGIGAFFFPLIAAAACRKRKIIPLALIAVLTLELLYLLIYRTRSILSMQMVGMVVGWFLLGPRLVWSGAVAREFKSGARRAVMVALALLMVGMSGLMIRSLRGQFDARSSGQAVVFDPWAAVAFGLQDGELNYSTPVMRVLEEIPAHYDYLHGQSYYRLLFVFIPRGIWHGKPDNSQLILARIIRPGADEIQTIPAGVVGDLYANFSYWGILGMFIFGWVFRAIDSGQGTASVLFLAVSFAMTFHFVRGGFTNPIVTLLILGVVAQLIAKYLQVPES